MNKLVHVGSRKHLEITDIVMLKSSINYTFIYLANGQKIIVSNTLKKLGERLQMHNSFVRPNRNTIVNLQFLTKYNDHSLTIKHEVIRISRRRKEVIKSYCDDYIYNP